jgi:hypothetical protein
VRWIVPAATVEAGATGLLLLVAPSLFSRLILGVAELSEAGQALGRLTRIAMIGAALGSWSAPAAASCPASALRVLTIYNLLATIYLAYLGFAGQLVGLLLWPAVVLHAVFSILLSRDRLAVARK